jgi:hypothetical protein
MPIRPAEPPGTELVPESVAAHLLARAGELDAAAAAAAVPVAELRAAAVEAGISERAFEAALVEWRQAGAARGRPHGRGWRRRLRVGLLAAVAAVLLAGGAFAVSSARRRAGRPPQAGAPQAGAPQVDERFIMRCLGPGEVVGLVRQLGRLPPGVHAMVLDPTFAPRVLNLHGTRAQLNRARALLHEYEGAGASGCTPRPPAAGRR